MSRARLLVVAPFLPVPPCDAQRVRTWNLASRLVGAFDVTLATWVPPGTDDAAMATCASTFDRLVVAPLGQAPMGLAHRVARHARFLSGGLPTYVQAMLDERRPGLHELSATLADIHAREPFDAVVLEEEAMAWMPVWPGDRPVVGHRLNVFYRVVGDLRAEHRLRRALHAVEVRAWRRFDRASSVPASLVITPTGESAEALRPLLADVPVAVVTNGVGLPPSPLRPSEGSDVVFVGWMSYPPNVDAVRWMVGEIWPLVRARHPGTRLRIVGRHPSPTVRSLAGPDVVVTGEVPDVVAACRGARLAVVPLRGGMGIKNKTLEAMAMGLPVVSTSSGAEGIPPAALGAMTVTDDAPAFARAVTALLDDAGLADQLGASGRARVEEHFGWEAIAAGYRDRIEETLRRTGPAERVSPP